MDCMEVYEVNSLIKNLKYVDRNQRELTRYQLLVNVQANSKNKVKLEDILKLPWDDEGKNTGTEITEDQANAIKERAKQLEKMIENTTIVAVENGEVMKNTTIR